ncbi:MAG TPA: type II secretion system protein [Candidatus Pacearchaeota archaeon]|nr:type II secretion system protein [Candidatus Pacearchaeota archaeon]HPR79685.1 type II secretion system protein [Candidatus Pacearchaeota archaeon]
MQKTKGFTLIELLVVIAIIGILSGLIIVSMSGAQNSAKDARIKSAMDQFRSTAEIYKMNNNGSYGSNVAVSITTDSCTANQVATSILGTASNPDGVTLCDDIQLQGSGTLLVNATSTAWCMQKELLGGAIWCIDSAGNVGSTNVGCSTSQDCL